MKCIGEKCPYYSVSDSYFTYCNIRNLPIGAELKCIGKKYIPQAIEEVMCKIAKLTTEYNRLSVLEEYIKDNQ